jgi:tetratricopeptide (TPR) repeat protein
MAEPVESAEAPYAGAEHWDVFISYAREDLELARELRERLIALGWSVFLADLDLNLEVGSTQWSERIDQVLDSTGVLLLLVTPHSLESSWVSYEWRSVHDALLSGHPGMLIPVCAVGPGPEQLPRALRRYQCVDARDPARRADHLQLVAALIRGYTRRSQLPHASLAPVAVSEPIAALDHGRRFVLAGFVLAGAMVAAALAWSGNAYRPPAPARRPPTTQAPAAQAELRVPKQGLRAIGLIERPEDPHVAEVRSASAWEEAERDFASANQQPAAPRHWRAAQHVAAAMRADLLGSVAEAEHHTRQAIAIEPDWATPHIALSGIVLARDPEAAIAEAKRARALDASLWIAVAALGSAYLHGGDQNRALEEYRRALSLAPQSNALKGEFALALHSVGGPYDEEAARLAREVLAVSDQMMAPHLVLAEQALERRAGELALQHSQRAAGLAPRDARVQLALGDALRLLDRNVSATAAWNAAIALAQGSALGGISRKRLDVVATALAQQHIPPPRSSGGGTGASGGQAKGAASPGGDTQRSSPAHKTGVLRPDEF